MKTAIRNIDQELELSETRLLTTVLENKCLFREVVAELARIQVETTDYSIVNCQDVDLADNLLLVSDVLSFDFANRKILSELYKRIGDNVGDDMLLALQKIEFELEKIAIMSETESGIDLKYKTEFSLADFLKVLKIEPAVDTEFDLKNRVYGIIDLVSRLLPDKIICLVNLKQLLTKDEFGEFCKYCLGHQRLVWCLETNRSYRVDEEEIIVVDEDLFSYKQA